MKNDIWSMLNETEQQLLREIQPSKLRKLDEEELVELHKRVRRARTKYAKNYRRGAAAQVAKDGSRAKATARFARTARKAEAFEDALAKVSTQLAKVAQDQADQLKEQRLAAARRTKGGKAGARPKGKVSTEDDRGSASTAKKKRRTPASKRSSAQARAAGKRHSASRATKG